ncbi:MAG: phosphoenolpyruvate--protein phosphotransferase [Selenomonadaceae bacterium]|nr:phosphoenolpyruvate--protein phosphotransferase [Selenomonadaceae bacterium]
MEVYSGKTINGSIAVGKIFFFSKNITSIKETADDPAAELSRYEQAAAVACEQLDELYRKALADTGEETAAIFEFHRMMLEDDDYIDSVKEYISGSGYTAEMAVKSTGKKLAAMFADMDDEYMKARSSDVRDVTNRLLTVLTGGSSLTLDEPVILAAEELTPGDTIQLDKAKLLGLVTDIGSDNSHTAILARSLDLPAIYGVKLSEFCDGKLAVLDGCKGELIVDPDNETLEKAREQLRRNEARIRKLQDLRDLPAVTKDGRRIKLYANIAGPEDVAAVLADGGEGVGIFRTEFLYMNSDDYPTEDEQFEAYKAVAEGMKGKEVIIRTLDIGADKQLDYLKLDNEDNPALGCRAIRICLTRPEIFRTQLRAILRASTYGNVSIMFPMIASLWEAREAKAILEKCRQELLEEGKNIGRPRVGVMIETPASVIISDMLAEEVDFFSIGTNDLTQYTLATDRQNPNIKDFVDTHHPAVLRMIKMTAENAHAKGISVAICGELGADLTLTEEFIEMGIDDLSVAPPKLLPLKEKIRSL